MSNNNTHEHKHHITPMPVYFKTLGALLVLTIATVAVSYFDFGKANIFVSLGIATFKASLVMMFFMGLKYDTALNRAVILTSFVALGLFLFFAAADLWTRSKPEPVVVHSTAAPLTLAEEKVLEVSTPELIAHGKEVFTTNCVPCHGPNGEGNGTASAGLNPPPRNFHGPLSAWKNGDSSHSIYVTLEYGVAGSGMASYKALPPQDRWALIHFLHTLTPEIQKTSAGDAKFETALKDDGIGAGAASATASKGNLPIDFAIDRMTNSAHQ